jgi:hypothetical protein
VDEEKSDNFYLLLLCEGNISHYTFISNLSRLICTQKTAHKEKVIFCKRCFTTFDNQPIKNTLYGQAALDQHNLICGVNKPILPQMPAPGTILEFDRWSQLAISSRSVKLPVVILLQIARN